MPEQIMHAPADGETGFEEGGGIAKAKSGDATKQGCSGE
jgi:hypothetical protein